MSAYGILREMEGHRFGLAALGFATFIAVSSFLAMLFRVDPAYADGGTISVFYVSVFVMVSSMIAWAFMIVRARLRRIRRPLYFFFTDAVRQGALVGLIVTISLILQANRNLSFVWILLIVAAAFIIEAFATRQMQT